MICNAEGENIRRDYKRNGAENRKRTPYSIPTGSSPLDKRHYDDYQQYRREDNKQLEEGKRQKNGERRKKKSYCHGHGAVNKIRDTGHT